MADVPMFQKGLFVQVAVDDYRAWLNDYFDRYRAALFETDVTDAIVEFKRLAERVAAGQGQLFFAGNGASAAIASHAAVDFTKQAKVRASTFNEPDLITCFANDYGYDHWIARAIEFYATERDAVVLISCSGKSPSVVRAAECARARSLPVVTFTGFAADNALRSLGTLNFWLDSRAYNVIESVHMIWITAVVDLIIGKAEYGVA